MTGDEQEKRKEAAERINIVEAEIELAIEKLGGQLSRERKDGLKAMAKPELQDLAQGLRDVRTVQDANTMIVKAICASKAARKAEEDRRLDGLCGPATISPEL